MKSIPRPTIHFGFVDGLPHAGSIGSIDLWCSQVDTNTEPPRSIWVHPYEDERFLREHPELRERLARELRTSDQPPPYTPRRHSFSGPPATTGSVLHFPVPERENVRRTSQSQPETPKPSQQRRSFFGKLKDKAIGTKEEREARRREEEQVCTTIK